MFLNKFFHFVKGYVILSLTGSNIERFLYIAAHRGILMWNIEKRERALAEISVCINDFFKLRQIALKTKTKVHIKKKTGLPIFLKKYKKRYFMFSGAAIFLLLLFLTSQFIWTVEIVGVENADIVKISEALKDSGLYPGAFKPKARSPKEVKNIILNRVDNISWAWIYLKGTKVICEVYEDTLPDAVIEDGEPCDIVAARDGIIKRIIAKEGKKTASSGDTVMAGDILISGVILNDEGNIGALVAADGWIEAYTWREKTDTYKLYYESKEFTGRQKTYNTIGLFSGKINLFLNSKIPYKDYVTEQTKHELKLWGDIYLGISFNQLIAKEVNIIRQPISYDMAVYEGKCDLEEKIAKELLPGAELVNERVSDKMLDDETAQVTVTMEFIEKIGRKAPLAKNENEE